MFITCVSVRCSLDSKTTSLTMSHLASKLSVTLTYCPTWWLSAMITGRAYSISMSRMYLNTTGSPADQKYNTSTINSNCVCIPHSRTRFDTQHAAHFAV